MSERKDLLNFINKLNEENEILTEENETLKKFIDDIINFEEVRNFLLNKHTITQLDRQCPIELNNNNKIES